MHRVGLAMVFGILVFSSACSTASTTRVAERNASSPPAGSVIFDTTPVAVPRDPDAPVWVSRNPAPDWLVARHTIESRDLVVGHSTKSPSREAALSMARATALQEAALQVSTDVRTRLEKTDTSAAASTASGEMRGSAGVRYSEEVAAVAQNALVGSRIRDEYYERFWSAQSGWSWKAHVQLEYDYLKSVSRTEERLRQG